jgi:hypothetical protein
MIRSRIEGCIALVSSGTSLARMRDAPLRGLAAMVAGGGSGIGEATCRVFGANGAAVLVVDVVAAQADRVAADVVAAGGQAVAAVMDTSNQDDVERAAAAAQATFGRLDILVTAPRHRACGTARTQCSRTGDAASRSTCSAHCSPHVRVCRF